MKGRKKMRSWKKCFIVMDKMYFRIRLHAYRERKIDQVLKKM